MPHAEPTENSDQVIGVSKLIHNRRTGNWRRELPLVELPPKKKLKPQKPVEVEVFLKGKAFIPMQIAEYEHVTLEQICEVAGCTVTEFEEVRSGYGMTIAEMVKKLTGLVSPTSLGDTEPKYCRRS